jgi:lipopolysaccharide transport system ATP-binding protein
MINLRFDHVSKRYRIYREPDGGTVSHPLARKVRRLWRNSEEFWALRNVSFDVERGEALGIIGHNGAGKSTILKLLYNITTPTRGEITIRGRLSALIEIASGFHPELTGRENIYLNGSLLGMKRREITKKLDSIVDFAEVPAFIDTPVKRYSTGMYLRLGFAIAAHLEPDILLLDEVLAVGDAAFQAKCIARITELKKTGKTIVFVSHNLGAIEGLCDRVLLIRQGQIVKDGLPRDTIAAYERLLTSLPAMAADTLRTVEASPKAEVLSIVFFNSEGRRKTMFSTGDQLRAVVEFVAHERVEDAAIEVYFYSAFGNLHTHFSTEFGGERIDLEPGRGIVEFFCPQILLEVAAFNVEVSIKRRGSLFSEHIDYKHGAVLNIGRGKLVHGAYHTPHTWRLKDWSEDGYNQEVQVIVKDVV